MAKSIVIRDNVLPNTPEIKIPISGGNGAEAHFWETSDSNMTGADLRNGKTGYGASGPVTGSMIEKAAATYTPTTSDQTIAADQYLAGAQTIKGDPSLLASNIVYGTSIFNVQGSVKVPIITQDSSGVVSIS